MSAVALGSISPELALVCPELRARALTLLPVIDPDALFRVSPRPPAAVVAPVEADVPFLLAVGAYATECVAMAALRAAVTISVITAVAAVVTLLA